MQIDGGVRLHRSTDVAHEDHPAGVLAVAGARHPQRLPAGRARRLHRLPEIDPFAMPVQLSAQAASPRPVGRRLLQPFGKETEVVGIEPLKRFVRACDDPARQGVGDSDVGGMGVDGGDRRRACGPRQATVGQGARAAGHTRVDGGGRSQALLQARWIYTQHGVREHRIEHRIESGQVLHPVHQRQPRRPVELRARSWPVTTQRVDESRWAAGGHHHTTGVRPVDQGNGEGGQVDATKKRRGQCRRRDTTMNISSTAIATSTAGPYFLIAPPPASSIRSIGAGSGAGLSTCPLVGAVRAASSSASPAASLASNESTNSPSSFSDTCCNMPPPNWASLPTILRSVSTVTLLRSPASCTPKVMVAAAFPVPRASRPRASTTPRCVSASRSTKCALPLNSLVTGPTFTLTLPR